MTESMSPADGVDTSSRGDEHRGDQERASSKRGAAVRLLNATWGQVVLALAALASIKVYTQLLSPSRYGECMLALGAVALIDSMTVLALNQTLLSRCSLHGEEGRRHEVALGITWSFIKRVSAAEILLGAIVGFGLAATGHGLAWATLPVLAVGYTSAEAVKTSLLSLLMLDRSYGRCSIWWAGESVTTLLVTSLSLAFWRGDALGFLVGYTVSRLVTASVFVLIFAPSHLRGLSRADVREELRPALAHGVPVALMGPLGWVSTFLDRYLLAGVLSTSATGKYAATTGLVARPYAVTTAVLTNYFRPLYYVSSRGRDPDRSYEQVMYGWIIAAAACGLLGMLGVLLLGNLIAGALLAAPYRSKARALMTLFAVAQTFTITTHAADNALLALHQGRRLIRAQGYLAVLTIPLVVAGVALAGIVGAVVGRCCAEALKMIVAVHMARSAATSLTGPDARARRVSAASQT